jgi:CubicO group peptidase (beta-lactamase class C family)
MTDLTIDLENGSAIEGFCAPEFSRVSDAFRVNFEQHGEVGASVCLVKDGQRVVDLWGGWADTGKRWQRDTISIVYSCTKGATAMCLHKLVEQGFLSYDTKVTDIWPEFSAGGKGSTTVAMMLSHTSPVPHLREPIGQDRIVDWDYMVCRVAAEEAFWEPGTRQGYHALTFAWTVGNLVRLVSGKPLGQYFSENFAAPLELDFYIGLPGEQEPRVAPMIAPSRAEANFESPFLKAAMNEPGSLAQLFLAAQSEANFNTPKVHAAEIGSANGITNARGLAGLYSPMARGGEGLIGVDTIIRMGRAVSATFNDAVLRQPMRFSLGFMLCNDNRMTGGDSLLIGETAFGHVGMGGSIGFADPLAKIGFGYSMNRMGSGILLNARGQSLVDAVYRDLLWRGSETGAWQR